MTGIWPRAPRRFWHVGPMARSIRDLALAFSQLAGPDGQDALRHQHRRSSMPASAASPTASCGWAGWSGPGFGPVDPEVAATVQGGGRGAQGRRRIMSSRSRIPALERDFALDVFNRLHVMEMKPAFARGDAPATRTRCTRWPRPCCRCPTRRWRTIIDGRAGGRAAARRLCRLLPRYDALITHVLPIPAHKHGVEEFDDRRRRPWTRPTCRARPCRSTSPGLPGLSMRFGTSREGLPINVQIVGKLAGGVDDPARRLAAGRRQPGAGPASEALTTTERRHRANAQRYRRASARRGKAHPDRLPNSC